MGFVDPLSALVISFAFLGIVLYKRVSLGIALVSTALLLSLLSLSLESIPQVLWQATEDPATLSLVGATFGIMLLSQLYKETKAIDILSDSLSAIVRNPKLVVSMLPAVIGLLPVVGGALMSAPMVETEMDRIGLKRAKKTYVNVWFRHVIFPVYPMSQVPILVAALTETPLTAIIVRQTPVVAVMIIVGYLVGLLKSPAVHREKKGSKEVRTNLMRFFLSFSPILLMILMVLFFGIDVWIAALLGVLSLAVIKRPSVTALRSVFSDKSLYMISLAAFGALLFRSVAVASGVSEVVGQSLVGEPVDNAVLLAALPAIPGFLVGQPDAGIAISVPMLANTLSFTSRAAGLLFISAFLGYMGSPTHLCLVLTAHYYKCPLKEIYKYLVPSLAISFAAAFLVYLLF